jgi:L-serine dehydratase
MDLISILNDVLGPVMRGPSSSHTAGAHSIGRMVRSLLDTEPTRIRVMFDPRGSYAPTYVALGVDIAFTAGVMGWPMTDDDFLLAIDKARSRGIEISFSTNRLLHSVHPNAVWIEADSGDETTLLAGAESIGGGAIRITQLDAWPVDLDGKFHDLLVEVTPEAADEHEELLRGALPLCDMSRSEGEASVLLHARCITQLDPGLLSRLQSLAGANRVRYVPPLHYVSQGEALFSSGAEMVAAAEERSCSLGQIALAYESQLLGIPEEAVLEEMAQRLKVMKSSVRTGLSDDRVDMLLLKPTARGILESETAGRVPVGGIHTRAAARAMAVMHACNSRAVVCAAPTGGSAGVIPGVLVSLTEERDLADEAAVLALLAAAAVGLVVAWRATFAAETAGCQVEIGAAGAMAAAAVVEAGGGSAQQAADAAAIALQNTMGSVCDPVHGTCEIPCHTRNAVAASSAFVCADIILGGYGNAVPLDETIDASYAVGKALPPELRCTASGGLAVTPSARSIQRLR